MANASLLVIQGVDQGARFEIGEEPVGVGRGVRNEIRILDTEVSRQHATFERSGDTFHITDRNSSNGTFVNGVAVRSRELKSGDQIQIGRSVMLFSTDDSAPPASAAERIDLIGRHDAVDRSSIVGELGSEAGSGLVSDTTIAGSKPLTQMLSSLQALYRVTEEVVSPSTSLEQLLQKILDLTIEVVGADRGCILLGDADGKSLVPRVFSHRRASDQRDRMPVSRSIINYVLKEGQSVRTSDARSDRRFEPGQSILQAGIREAMCVPMQGRFSIVGVVYVDTTTPPERVLSDGSYVSKFTEEQLRLLVAIGRQSALAIENNRYQQALLKAERLAAMGQTIAMLSHHIKNILQGVRGGSYLIDMGLKDHNEDLIGRGWGIVEKNQGKIYNLVMDMLTFSKERKPEMAVAPLNDTVAEVAELMQARADECRVRLEYRPAADMPPTTFDPEGLHRAVLNIVTNAIDAVEGGENAAVRIETGWSAAADTVFVAVTDNGPGIPDDQRPKIFNIFESTKGSRGTGLGLAVSQKIIREHGGEITVESKPGDGCQFVLCWPRMDEDHRPADGPTQAAAGGTP